jgi:hypothetical protein
MSVPKPNVLHLTDSTGKVLGVLTMPLGTYDIRAVPVGEQTIVYGDAVVIQKRPGGI